MILLKFWREILIVVLILLFASSVRQCSVNGDDARLMSHIADSSFSVANYYKTKNGELVGQVKTHQITIGQLKKYGEDIGFQINDLTKQVGNANRLVAHWRGKAHMSGSATVALKDSIVKSSDLMDLTTDGTETVTIGKYFAWSNNHLELDGFISVDSNQISINYKYSTDFTLTAYRKPQGLFKPRQLVADIWFDDPNMKVREFKGFVIQEPRRRFYQTSLFQVSIAVGAGFLIGRSL